jgi:hypothetical protein
MICYVQQNKNRWEPDGGKCHTRTMIHIEVGKTYKMNTQHVPFSQSVEEIRLYRICDPSCSQQKVSEQSDQSGLRKTGDNVLFSSCPHFSKYRQTEQCHWSCQHSRRLWENRCSTMMPKVTSLVWRTSKSLFATEYKKSRSDGKKCHSKSMMKRKTEEVLKFEK